MVFGFKVSAEAKKNRGKKQTLTGKTPLNWAPEKTESEAYCLLIEFQ